MSQILSNEARFCLAQAYERPVILQSLANDFRRFASQAYRSHIIANQ